MNKIKMLLISGVCALFFAAFAAGETVNASKFGFNTDDATETLQKAIDSGVATVIVDNVGKPWILRPIKMRSDLTLIFAKGTQVIAKKGEYKSRFDCLFEGRYVKNITIKGEGDNILAMQKADYLDIKKYEKSEWRHLLSFSHAENITITDLTIRSSGGDGIYINDSKNVTITNIIAEDHHRQGCSIISAENLLIKNCRFDTTNGTAPMAGIDFEPNNPKEYLINCRVENCTFTGNAGDGILFHLTPLTAASKPVSVTVKDCKFTSNNFSAIAIDCSAGHSQVKGSILLENCVASGKGKWMLSIFNQHKDGFSITSKNCTFDGRNTTFEPFNFRTEANSSFANITFDNVKLLNSGSRKAISFNSTNGSPEINGTLKINGKALDLKKWCAENKIDAANAPFAQAELNTAKLTAPAAEKCPAASERLWFRGKLRFLQYADKGESVTVTINNKVLGNNKYALPVKLLAPSGKVIKEFSIPSGVKQDCTFTAPETGFYTFVNVTGFPKFSSGRPGNGMVAENLSLFAFSKAKLYFEVPAGAKVVALQFKGQNSEYISAVIRNESKNQVMGELKRVTLARNFQHTRTFFAKSEIWSIEVTEMKEDSSVSLGGDLNPVVSFSPDALPRAK